MTVTRRLWLCAVTVAGAMLVSALVAPGASASSAGSFVSLVNSARGSAGLHGYAVSSQLAAVAQGQAQRMASQQRLYHNPGLASQVTNWKYVGENVGYGPDVSTLFSAFMHSSAHRANILDHDFTQIGVGTVTVNGTLWVSMVFRDPMRSTATKPSVKPRTSTAKKKVAASGAARTLVRKPAAAKPVLSAAAAADRTPGLVCAATAAAADRARDVTDLDRMARLVESGQLVVRGFQCGRALPMTGVLDDATLKALEQV
jgi:Cysteine-rich secretory protein family